jgi:SnoaL-like domain
VPTALTAHLLAPMPTGVADLLTDDVRFASPFADYAGRDTIARLFAAMPHVFEELEAVRELTGQDGERATVLRGRIGDHAVDGVLDERYAPDGHVAEAILLLRPHAAVKEAIKRMGVLLGTA